MLEQMMNKLIRLIVFVGILAVLVVAVKTQDKPQTRSITSDDFDRARPVSTKSVSKTGARKPVRRVTYKFVRKDNAPGRSKSAKTKPKAGGTQPTKVSEIGVTMWKLRPPRRTDKGVKLPVKIDGETQMWAAERVGLDTEFVAKDRVRLAIESYSTGYLYVINNELNSDGTLGQPCLLFPESLGDGNSVTPGMLVDFPDQTESFPYFLINPKGANYSGELLTVIISQNRFTNLKTEKNGDCARVNIEEMVNVDPDAEVEIFSRLDAADKIYTKAEAASACGSKTRELERVKSTEKPCGMKTRELTREEPLPQSVYRVKTAVGHPIVAYIRLNVKH